MNKLLSLVFAMFLGLFIVGCGEPDGPAENAGETVDEGVENTGDALEDAGEEMEETYEESTED